MQIEQQEIIIRLMHVNLKGRLDANSVLALKDLWRTYDEHGQHNILLDLHQVDFIDSIGISTLVNGLKQCRAKGGDLRLIGLQPSARAVFELMMLDRVFEIFETREEALKGF